MIEVRTINEGSWTIDFTTTDEVKLAVVAQKAPFDCVTLFQNGQPTRMLRDVEFCLLEHQGQRFIRVQHSDPAMNAMMEQIKQRQP